MSSSKRFCVSCERVTTWKYNPVLAHSRCSECAGRFSYNPENVEMPENSGEIRRLREKVGVLQKKIVNQKAIINSLQEKLRGLSK